MLTDVGKATSLLVRAFFLLLTDGAIRTGRVRRGVSCWVGGGGGGRLWEHGPCESIVCMQVCVSTSHAHVCTLLQATFLLLQSLKGVVYV